MSPVDGAAVDAGGVAIVSAFFGLDNALPRVVELICPGGGGRDGMPVTFSRRVVGTPASSSFRVVTRSGARREPACATLSPATGATERHTVLLGGDLGEDASDPPVRVEVSGPLMTEGGDARGIVASVVPLSMGPSLVLALRYASIAGSACPASTLQVVQVTWNGGVTAAGGGDVGDMQRRRIHITLARAGGAEEVTPASLADLGDNDNYLHLCLDTAETPLSVRVEAGTFVDPRNDPNAETQVAVTPGS